MSEEIFARLVLLVGMGGSGILMLWMAAATASGRLGRNQIAGIRIPSTMVSDDAWLAAHRRAKRPNQWAGWTAIVSVVPALLPVPMWMLVVAVLVGCVALLVFTLYGAVVGSRAATQLTQQS